MKTTLLIAVAIGLVAVLTVKKPDETPKPSTKNESKTYPGGATKHRFTDADGTVRCTFTPPGQKAFRVDCVDFDK